MKLYQLRESGEAVVMLDGDELREVFRAVASNIENHGREVCWLWRCNMPIFKVIAEQGITVVLQPYQCFTRCKYGIALSPGLL